MVSEEQFNSCSTYRAGPLYPRHLLLINQTLPATECVCHHSRHGGCRDLHLRVCVCAYTHRCVCGCVCACMCVTDRVLFPHEQNTDYSTLPVNLSLFPVQPISFFTFRC